MDDYRDYWVKAGKYPYTEEFPINGKVIRYSKSNGQIVREDNVLPQSQYRVRLQHIGSVRDPYLRNVFLVERISNGEIFGTDTKIAFNGGWAERFLALFSGAGGGTVSWCSNTEQNPLVRHEKLVATVLKNKGRS